MRRIVIWLASTVTIVVLLFGYHTSTNKATPSAGSTSSPPPASTSMSAGTSAKAKTYAGSVAQTRWGPVQVQITVQNDKITKVTVLQQPNGNHRDEEINAQALPTLIQDTLDAQSAKIDMVSGATITSDGYIQSLQAALDAAGR